MENLKELGRIGVLMGGPSSEREISLRSGRAVCEALRSAGCHVVPMVVSSDEREILDLLRFAGVNVAFIALHGRFGEDGGIQKILDKAGLPYTGCGVKASQIAINKILTQKILKEHGIPVPKHCIIKKGQQADVEKIFADLNGPPVVVKPAEEGSSIGITLVQEKKNFAAALSEAFKYGADVLVEQYINGRELTVGILGNKTLSVIEIKPKEKFFDFTAKYQKGLTEYLIPAPLPENVKAKVQDLALKTYKTIGCRHLARIDFMLDEKNNPFVLEINTIPGFTETSLLPKAAKYDGLDFSQLCLNLVRMAYEKKS